MKQPYMETEWKVRLFCTAVLKKWFFLLSVKNSRTEWKVRLFRMYGCFAKLIFFTSVENSRTFEKIFTKYNSQGYRFWLQKSFIAHTTSQIWKPALRYEKKIDFEKLIFFIFLPSMKTAVLFGKSENLHWDMRKNVISFAG